MIFTIKSHPFQITEEVEKLKALKLEMGEAPSAGGKLILKTAKGTRDYEPHMMAVREKVLDKVSNRLLQGVPSDLVWLILCISLSAQFCQGR